MSIKTYSFLTSFFKGKKNHNDSNLVFVNYSTISLNEEQKINFRGMMYYQIRNGKDETVQCHAVFSAVVKQGIEP